MFDLHLLRKLGGGGAVLIARGSDDYAHALFTEQTATAAKQSDLMEGWEVGGSGVERVRCERRGSLGC